MDLTKLFSRKGLPTGAVVPIPVLDTELDVETDRFGERCLRLTRLFTRRKARLDVAGYREERRRFADRLAEAANVAESVGRSYAAELRRYPPMDREEEFRMARRHEFMVRMLGWHLAGFGFDSDEARQLLRKPIGEVREAVAGRRSRRRVDPEWFDRTLESFRDLRNLYVEGALYLVSGTVSRYRGLGVEVADLVQEGNASLFSAIDGFDWRRDVRFRTYAQYWVQQAVLKMLYNHARTVRVPIWVQKILGRIRKLQASSRREGRELGHEEIAEALDLPVEKIKWVLESRRFAVSLDAEVGHEDGKPLVQLMADESLEPIPESIPPGDLGEALAGAMADLPDRERHILEGRFGLDGREPRTLGDIAGELGITPERVRQLQNAALQRLKKPTKRKLLRAFVE